MKEWLKAESREVHIRFSEIDIHYICGQMLEQGSQGSSHGPKSFRIHDQVPLSNSAALL